MVHILKNERGSYLYMKINKRGLISLLVFSLLLTIQPNINGYRMNIVVLAKNDKNVNNNKNNNNGNDNNNNGNGNNNNSNGNNSNNNGSSSNNNTNSNGNNNSNNGNNNSNNGNNSNNNDNGYFLDTTLSVKFDAAGGSTPTSNKTVTYGGTYGKLPKATRKYYDFDGWYMYASGGAKITEETTVTMSFPHTLYARWQGQECNLVLNANGGELEEKSVKIRYGNKYQLPTPERDNYNFDGWYTAKTDGNRINSKSIFDENSVKTLYAHWSEQTFKITLVAYNGEVYYKEVSCGKKYGTLPKPKRSGYTFGGWYTWEDYSDINAEPITKNSIVQESTKKSLFARWYN